MKSVVEKLLVVLGTSLLFLALLEGCGYLFGDPHTIVFHINPLQMDPDAARKNCYAAAKPAPPDRELLFTLGGSSASGTPLAPGSNFTSVLHSLLQDAYPGRFEAISYASNGKDSFYIKRCAEYLFRQKPPKYLIIYGGDNDPINFGLRYPRTFIFLESNPWLLRPLIPVFIHSRGLRLIAQLRKSRQYSSGDLSTILENEGVVLRQFVSNIESVIDHARDMGTKVILLTVASNLHDTKPFISLPSGPNSATDAYEKGRALYKSGKRAEALAELRRAKDLDFSRLRGSSSLNEAIRAVARTHPNTILIDFEKRLDEVSKGVIGCNYFGNRDYCDHVHPNEITHQLIAKALFTQIQELEGASAP